MDHRGEAGVFTLGSALPLAASSLSRSGSRRDVGACTHKVVLVLAFPHKAEPCFSRRLLGCLLLSDVTSIFLM